MWVGRKGTRTRTRLKWTRNSAFSGAGTGLKHARPRANSFTSTRFGLYKACISTPRELIASTRHRRKRLAGDEYFSRFANSRTARMYTRESRSEEHTSE